MTRPAILSFLVLASMLCLGPRPVPAVQPSARLLPPTTKGYLSVPDVDLLRTSFQQTQLGRLAVDPLMKPFFDDLGVQLENKLGRTDDRLSITMDDLRSVYGGEVALATIQPGGDEKQYATVLLVDITGHLEQAESLLKRIEQDLAARGSKRSVRTVAGVELIGYVLPRREGEAESRQAFYFIREDQLVASDHEPTIRQVLGYFGDDTGSRLDTLPSYQTIMQRCAAAAGDSVPHLRWFIEPFGYVQALRAAAGGRQRRGTDLLKVLKDQGFSAIDGLGGYVSFSSESVDIVHRSFVYAPGKAGAQRYELAARMLAFPNAQQIAPEDWVPTAISNYLSFHWKMKEAFEFSKTLVDEVAGAAVFEDILESLKQDPSGPQIDIRQGLVRHLGERVTFFTDHRQPITTTSERWLMAFEVTNPAVVAQTLDKAMEADPDATRRKIGRQVVWEILRQEQDAEIEELDIGGVGFGELPEDEGEDGAPLLEHAALTVSFGYLIVASHLDFLEQVFAETSDADTLAGAEQYQRVGEFLDRLGADGKSFRLFSRTDQALHTSYELIRQGKMPESETLMGAVLNRLLGPEERGVLREQQIPGDKLPEYAQVRHYFGPAGAYVRSAEDGWFAAGVFLPQQPAPSETPAPAAPAAADPAVVVPAVVVPAAAVPAAVVPAAVDPAVADPAAVVPAAPGTPPAPASTPAPPAESAAPSAPATPAP